MGVRLIQIVAVDHRSLSAPLEQLLLDAGARPLAEGEAGRTRIYWVRSDAGLERFRRAFAPECHRGDGFRAVCVPERDLPQPVPETPATWLAWLALHPTASKLLTFS